MKVGLRLNFTIYNFPKDLKFPALLNQILLNSINCRYIQ